MVSERFQDLHDDTGKMHFYGWRCLSCGEIIDPLILNNRSEKPSPFSSKNRKLLVYR